MRLEDNGFALSGVAARLGSPERVTRIDLGQLTGRIAGGGVGGQFAGGSGQIGNVPLLLGVILIGTIVVIAVNLLVDIAYAWLDPRIASR